VAPVWITPISLPDYRDFIACRRQLLARGKPLGDASLSNRTRRLALGVG
jgi:hypothetical protein